MPSQSTTMIPPPSAELRRIATESFDRANQVAVSGNYDYAIQLLKTCCRIDPANLLYRQTLRKTQKSKFNNNMRGSRFAFLTTIRHKARLKTAKRSRDYLKVLEFGEEILSRNPWDPGTQMDMAEAADAVGLLDTAVFILDQARQKYPKDVTLNRSLARLLEKRGNFSQAIALWQLVREVVPNDLEAAHKAKDLAANETIQRGLYEEGASGEVSASRIMEKSPVSTTEEPQDRLSREAAPLRAKINANPTEPQPYLQLAALYRKYNLPEQASAILQQGLGPTGQHFQIQVELMELELEPFRRDLHLLEERIKRAKANPDDPDEEHSLEELQKLYSRMLREILSREIELYRLRADRFPNEMSHRLDLGIRLMKVGQFDEAIVELQLARKDQRLQWKALMNLGICFKRRNNWRLAQRNFEEALQALPATEEQARKEIIYQLAQGHAEAGDLAKAIDLGHELANLDFGFRDIGRLIDEWQAKLQEV